MFSIPPRHGNIDIPQCYTLRGLGYGFHAACADLVHGGADYLRRADLRSWPPVLQGACPRLPCNTQTHHHFLYLFGHNTRFL